MHMIAWGLAAFAAVTLAGCYESPDVTVHKPGVYKGPKDPLVQKQSDPKHQEALISRFNQVQTDR